MKQTIRFIKITYIIGIIADGFWAIAFVIPGFYSVLTNNRGISDTLESRLILYIAASLMAGWTILLAWGYRKPIERRFILLITAFPVVFGLILVTLLSVINGNQRAMIFTGKTAILFVLMLLSFFKAKKIANAS